MPLYNFRCQCGQRIRKLMKVEDFEALRPQAEVACKCGLMAKRERGAATSQTMEVLDNGFTARPVERLAEAERIFKEREYAHDQKYGIKEDEDE